MSFKPDVIGLFVLWTLLPKISKKKMSCFKCIAALNNGIRLFLQILQVFILPCCDENQLMICWILLRHAWQLVSVQRTWFTMSICSRFSCLCLWKILPCRLVSISGQFCLANSFHLNITRREELTMWNIDLKMKPSLIPPYMNLGKFPVNKRKITN